MTRNRWLVRAYGNIVVVVGAIIASQFVSRPPVVHGILLVVVGLYAGAGCAWVIMWPVQHPELPFRRVFRIAVGREELP